MQNPFLWIEWNVGECMEAAKLNKRTWTMPSTLSDGIMTSCYQTYSSFSVMHEEITGEIDTASHRKRMKYATFGIALMELIAFHKDCSLFYNWTVPQRTLV